MKKLLIATKEILPAEMLKRLFIDRKLQNTIEIIHNGEKALDFIIDYRPRLVILDLYLPVLGAIAIMEELERVNLYPRVICYCNEINPRLCVKLFKNGISGLIDYSTSFEEAKSILQKVEAGKVVIPDCIIEAIQNRDFEINQEKYTPLTIRQTEIIHLIGEGYTNLEISEKLNISNKTVEKHKCLIKEKLGLSSATKIAVYAVTHGFVQLKEVV